MRTMLEHELEQLEEHTLDGVDLTIAAVDAALGALVLDDPLPAIAAVAADERIEARCTAMQTAIVRLLARQSPLAGDLRLVIALIHVNERIERIGCQCAEMARLAACEPGETRLVESLILHHLTVMGRIAQEQLRLAKDAFLARDLVLARQLSGHDRQIDALQHSVFQRAVAIGVTPAVRPAAMRATLIARCLERVGDNAVRIGECGAFVLTGRIGRDGFLPAARTDAA